MITQITIRNFKKLDDVSFEVGNPVVFIGPNNSGKTTALQAIGLWALGTIKWYGARKDGKPRAKKRSGVPINRNDLLMLPVSTASLLWSKTSVRRGTKKNGKPATENIVIQIIVEGRIKNNAYKVGFEFDYANSESFYVRVIEGEDQLETAIQEKVAFLQPMSGLGKEETKLVSGAIDRLIGEGKTAEVLRNICYQLYAPEKDTPINLNAWEQVKTIIQDRFGVTLSDPVFIAERGVVELKYKEKGVEYDLASMGRGCLQTLLLLAYLFLHPQAILLLDEPDAHLEVLRQREIYNLLVETSTRLGSQIIIASHSEVVLNEAADKNTVVAFIGSPHTLNKASHLRKSLTDIGWEKYAAAEQKGYVLFLEGSTDLDMLRAFAKILEHPTTDELQRPNVIYLNTNLPHKAQEQFQAIKEAFPALKGFAVFDRLDGDISDGNGLEVRSWRRREFENYFCSPELLCRFAESFGEGLFAKEPRKIMEDILAEELATTVRNDLSHRFWQDTKVSTDFLPIIFKKFKEGFPSIGKDINKSEYFRVISFMRSEEVDQDIKDVLDALQKIFSSA